MNSTNRSLVNLPADPEYLPRSSDLPESFLEQAAGPTAAPPDEERWLSMWDVLEPDLWTIRRTNSLLPKRRQARHWRCRKRAAHLRKTSSEGHVAETVNPISCDDRVACMCCSYAYKNDRMLEHAERIRVIALNGACAVHFAEFRAVVPEFDASTTVAGCHAAEEIGGLCVPRTHCTACDRARAATKRRITIAQELRDWLRAELVKRAAGTGGLASITPEPAPGEATELVVTLVVPQVAIGGVLGRRPADPLDYARLYDDFRAWLQERFTGADVVGGGLDASDGAHVRHRYGSAVIDVVTVTQQINERLARMHEPAWHRFHRNVIAATEAGATVTQEHARRAIRGVTLEAATITGGSRKWQDTAWFGAWAGPRAAANLAQLNIQIITPEERPAKTEVVDVYRVIAHLPTGDLAVQSTRTAALSVVERAIVRFNIEDTVDGAGRPTRARSKTWWKDGGDVEVELEGFRRITAQSKRFYADLQASRGEFPKEILGKLPFGSGR